MENANGLSSGETERLAILVEELGESVKAIGKILRHGYESHSPDNPKDTNRRDLEMELADVDAAKTMMYAAKDISQMKVKRYCRKKLAKPNRYLHHQPDNIARPPAMIVVAGSRGWDDYDNFCDCLEKSIRMFGVSNFVIVSGQAKSGADAMAIQWAEENNQPWIPFPADWDKLGRQAGYVRNGEMAEAGSHLVAFWDMQSNGTQNMINLALSKDIPTLVFKVHIESPGEILHG